MFIRLVWHRQFDPPAIRFDFPMDHQHRSVLGEVLLPRHSRSERQKVMYFNQEETTIIIPGEILALPLIGRNRSLAQLNDQMAEEQMARQRGDLAAQAESTIASLLQEGRCSAANLAEELNMGPRNLCNHLDKQHTSYKKLLETVRKRLAVTCLHEPVDVSTVARRLGYTQTGNFTRAFRQWYGASPAEFQRDTLHWRLH